MRAIHHAIMFAVVLTASACLSPRYGDADEGCYLGECDGGVAEDGGVDAGVGGGAGGGAGGGSGGGSGGGAGGAGGGAGDAGHDGGTDAGGPTCTDDVLDVPEFGPGLVLPHFSESGFGDLVPSYSPGAHRVCATRFTSDLAQRMRCGPFTLVTDGGLAPMQPFINTVVGSQSPSAPGLTDDGETLYFHQQGTSAPLRILVARWSADAGTYGVDGFQEVFPNAQASFFAPDPSPDGTELFGGMVGPGGDQDVFLSTLDGGLFSGPQPLSALNDSDDDDSHPALSPDGRWLVFYSLRSNPMNSRVFISQRTCSGWRAPLPLGLDGGIAGEVLRRADWGPDGGLVVEREHGNDPATADILFFPRR